jgi:predicted nucleotidyltransferase
MVFTEIKERNRNKYYYRVLSLRKENKTRKIRKYLGKNLSKNILKEIENVADKELLVNRPDKRLKKLKNKIISILKKNMIKRAGIFGSYARGEQRRDSDIDILIEPRKGMGFGFAGLEIQLSKALKKKVDLVSYNGISPYLKERILNEEVKIL